MVSLWPKATQDIEMMVKLDIVSQENGKPAIQLEFADGTKKTVSANIGEMIGGAASGARLRYEENIGRN